MNNIANLKSQLQRRREAVSAFIEGKISREDLDSLTSALNGANNDARQHLANLKMAMDIENHNRAHGRNVSPNSLVFGSIDEKPFFNKAELQDSFSDVSLVNEWNCQPDAVPQIEQSTETPQ